jgi:hypothetical protein
MSDFISVHLDSPSFQNLLSLLKYLKFSKDIVLQTLCPKLCLSCWTIFTRETELYHSDSSKHRYTNEFNRMVEADQRAVINIAKQNKRFDKDTNEMKMFKIEGKTLNDLILKDIKYNFEDIPEIDR